MKHLNNIINFFIFRYSFVLKTEYDIDTVKTLIISKIKRDISFQNPTFGNNYFAFSHKNIMPSFYNVSPILFLAELQNETKVRIKVTVNIVPIYFWFFAFSLFSIVACFILNIGGFRDQFANTSFPFIPLYSPVFIVLPYIYYGFKIQDVKGTLKVFLK